MAELIFQKANIGLGKRKQAIARVFLIPGEGNILINKVNGNQYLQYNDTYLRTVWSPLQKLNLANQFDIVAIVRGGGLTGQAQAIQFKDPNTIITSQKKIVLRRDRTKLS